MSDSTFRIVSPKRVVMILRLKSDEVCSTSVLLLISTGTQSENQVLIAVGVSWRARTFKTSFQISFREFISDTSCGKMDSF